jgi:hypothetical protein
MPVSPEEGGVKHGFGEEEVQDGGHVRLDDEEEEFFVRYV